MERRPQGRSRRNVSRDAPGPDRVAPAYLSLRELSTFSGLSVRSLRKHLDDPQHPLPCYRVGGKVLVRVVEFDAWIAAFRRQGRVDVKAIVDDVLNTLRTKAPRVRRDRP